MKHMFKMLFIMLSLLFSINAWALPSDKHQTIHVEADHVSIDDKNQISIYKGNVAFQQGSIEITADVVKLHTLKGRLNRIIATGNPATFKQQLQQDKRTVQGRARNVEYILKEQLLSFTREAHFQQGENTFSGDKMVYDIENDILKAHGNKLSGERVKIVIQPATLGRVAQ